MEQYIPKSTLVAEIEKRINEINLDSIEDWRYRLQRERDIGVMKNILSLINTLEVKEADLNEEIEKCLKRHNMLAIGKKDFTDIAKHFFELGLKVAQKGK
jgi:hypothetical protein